MTVRSVISASRQFKLSSRANLSENAPRVRAFLQHRVQVDGRQLTEVVGERSVGITTKWFEAIGSEYSVQCSQYSVLSPGYSVRRID